MKILICDQQRMLAEALACALDARGYDILAVVAAVSDAPTPADDWVPMSACSACSLAISRAAPIPSAPSCDATPARRCWCCQRPLTPRRCLSS